MGVLIDSSPIATLANRDWLFIAVVMVPGAAIAIVAVILDNWRKVQHTRQREESRREIAAYVAEGSLSPDDAVRILAAGESLKDKLGMKL